MTKFKHVLIASLCKKSRRYFYRRFKNQNIWLFIKFDVLLFQQFAKKSFSIFKINQLFDYIYKLFSFCILKCEKQKFFKSWIKIKKKKQKWNDVNNFVFTLRKKKSEMKKIWIFFFDIYKCLFITACEISNESLN